jgi:hypothetical protein
VRQTYETGNWAQGAYSATAVTTEVEAGGSRAQSQPGQHSESLSQMKTKTVERVLELVLML